MYKARGLPPKIPCQGCGKEFQPTRRGMVVCGGTCRQRKLRRKFYEAGLTWNGSPRRSKTPDKKKPSAR